MNKTLLAIFAHPDDAEIVCAGTLILMKNAGWKVHIATMTPGDKGSTEHTREEISRIRKAEAAESVKILGGSYTCLGFEDVYIEYNRESINRTTALLRRIRPSVVFTSSPDDYMIDHEMTSLIVQTACFSAGIKNMEVEEAPFEPVPHLYYSDPLEGKNKLGNSVIPSIYIDISSVIDLKEKMLACHVSQANWLKTHHQGNEYLMAMRRFGEKRGREIKVKYAEGFRQHLGHGYPQDDILSSRIPEFSNHQILISS
ncbi:MAG: family deacetylase [Bacteroidota bacterium]|nr:family deacetylase [Bacteroidota bacterium]